MNPTREELEQALAEFDKWVDDDRYTLNFNSIEVLADAARRLLDPPEITDELVERAAKAHYLYTTSVDAPAWEQLPAVIRGDRMREMRVGLVAALNPGDTG